MTHRGPFQPLPFCGSVKAAFMMSHNSQSCPLTDHQQLLHQKVQGYSMTAVNKHCQTRGLQTVNEYQPSSASCSQDATARSYLVRQLYIVILPELN